MDRPLSAASSSMISTGAANQDFVLFDDSRLNGHQSTLSSATSYQQQPSHPMAVNPSMTMTSRPSQTHKPSFTEYRASQTGNQNESPFSSPASKPGDDFGSDDNHIGVDEGSGTLAYGTPKSKRQRGHGYSSSWNGGNLQQHRYQNQQNRQASGGVGTLASAMMPTQSFGGYQRGENLSDWSGSDTSPHNPPSGSFGPPIQSLSLGDGSDGVMPSLFPASTSAMTPTSTLQPASDMMAFQAAYQSSNPNFQGMTPRQQQEERSRQQIRAELMGVDSRALKGPLRDIQQGRGSQDVGGSGQYPNVDFNSFGSSNFFPAVQSMSNPGERPDAPIRQRSGSLDESFLTSNLMNGNNYAGWNDSNTNDMSAYNLQGLNFRSQHQQEQEQQYQDQLQSSFPPSSPPGTARPSMPGPQFSSRTQQAVDRARAQKPTRKRFTRDQSGLTVSPQEAFLDYDSIESLMQASRAFSQSLPATAHNLFAPPPPGLQEILGSENMAQTPKATSRESSISANFAVPASHLSSTHEGTPSLVDASSNSSSNGSISSPLQRMPLNREDTVRPSKSQAGYASQQAGRVVNDDLFSPAYSTSSSTDDEDEKPYISNSSKKQASSNPNMQFPFPAQSKSKGSRNGPDQQQQHQQQQQQQQHHNNHNQHHHPQLSHLPGPRFSVVSSSSSESEDDDQRVKVGKNQPLNQQGRRAMGGYGYMGSSEESGLSVTTPYNPQQFAHQPSYSSSSSHQLTSLLPTQPSMNSSSSSSSQTNLQANLGSSGGNIKTPQSGGGQSDSQSQDDDPSISPSIRSSAQAIYPLNDTRPTGRPATNTHHETYGQSARQRSRSRNRNQTTAVSSAANRRDSDAGSSNSVDETSEWETGDDSEADGSDYQEDRRAGGGGTGGASSNGPNKKSTSTKKRRRDGTTRHQQQQQGGSGWGATSSGTHLTVCDYVSPLTGENCRTEFHRPYDLARHRETIHAREEALLMRQGRLKKEQCVVLYKEVDPEKSLATVEWKCEGKNGCGSLFSRKDALLRHKRIRGH